MSPPMDGLKSQIGRLSSERKVTLSGTEMRDFATCVKATVGATSHSPISSVAIPTVFTIFRQGEFELMDALGIQLKQVLHAEQEYELKAPLSPSEEIRFVTRLASVVEKKSKTANMAFMAFETDFVRVADEVTVATARSTMVYRELLG
ncbi:MAG: MaoC family dehydratase N-terminal domain-containing protein [Bdellovibrionales bacterium]|nr:MaoC family dehydratase N-terminal domain-containing protein [Bdellovibrionales bacterium]